MFSEQYHEKSWGTLFRSVLFVVLIVAPATAFGDGQDTPFSFESWDPAITEKGKEIPAPFYSILGATIGHTTLQEVQQRLGDSPIYKRDSDRHSPKSLCYRAHGPSDRTAIVFESNLFGWGRLITSIFVSSNWSFKEIDLDRCQPSDFVSRETLSSNGITLDSTMDQVKELLGKPTLEHNHNKRYIFKKQGPSRLEKYPYATISSGFDAVATEDGLAWFRVYRIESY